jgi:hypothetical protein
LANRRISVATIKPAAKKTVDHGPPERSRLGRTPSSPHANIATGAVSTDGSAPAAVRPVIGFRRFRVVCSGADDFAKAPG